MVFKPFRQKINLRLIVIHTIALWLFVCAFELFGRLPYLDLLRVYNEQNIEGNPRFTLPAFMGSDSPQFHFLAIGFLTPIVGLLVGSIVSIIIARFRKWFWVNSLLAFLIMGLLCLFDITYRNSMDSLYFVPDNFFRSHKYLYAIDAWLLLAIGFLLFFLKPVNDFIKRHNTGKQNSSL